ncbi:membrane protein [Clostridium botulinum]|uniref:Uncharacterized protein n=1 Tax=Clostridium botulinum (strain Langeland / NCTC 10281 / Type F) TaxID=441772 RepID=A7GA04_CLOBL|nr:membrane protein [Clostridium botulinum]ABS40900.1 conserved hypothetical protein [Clostridium botulinum F str. Langeland]ADF98085.1 conserved hypothetical protein [Clostridium botulinum F str. 230613]KKM41556.1 membrane protein [Clostridium botulinum]MBY6792741.1 hypothetical protein [Clostridium botulinum]MBY6938388.1 hypothetical protein [Clostridium botulinum]
MINVIKTAIITIIISFISGLLLDHYRNLAPRILCNIGKGIPIDINNKKFNAYIITVRNISNKIIHDITLNVQSHQSNLKITDAKITKGLKFDSSIEDNILDVSIPFLSKDDEFSVTVYVDNQYGSYKEPVVIIRSPENFKEVNSEEKRGIFSIFTNIPKNIKEIISDATKKDETINEGNRQITNKNNKLGKNKKVMIMAASVVLVVIVGVVARFYFKGKPADTNTKTPSVETKIPKQSNDSKGSTDKTTKGTDVKSSTDGKTKNTDGNSSTGGSSNNTDEKPSTGGTNGNTNKKPSTGDTNKSPSTGDTTGNKDGDSSKDGTTNGKTDGDSSNSGTTNDGDKNPSTGGGTTGNTDEKPSTDGTKGDTGN